MNYVDCGLCCDVCTIAIANDDYSGTSDAEEAATKAGMERIGHYLIVGDEWGFTWRSCDLCGALAGNRHEFGYLESAR